MALRSPGGFCHFVRRDLRIKGVLDASLAQRLCVKPVEEENAFSSSSQKPNGLLSMEISNDAGKRSRDNLCPLPKPLSNHDSTEGSNVRVAYQGLPGAFSEVAALKAYPQSETVPCDEFEIVFKAVELWAVDKAVIPIENTVSGSVHRNYDLLLWHKLHIVGEVQLAVNHCLMALPGVKKEDLKRVLSHSQAFSQCEGALNKLLITRESTDSTAAAAQLVSSKKLRDAGAIASPLAAQIYGLNILEEGIQDFPNNVTRFIILARVPIIPRLDRPFKIESRPQRERPLRVVDLNNGTAMYFDYLFHVDFEASMADLQTQNALSHLKEFATFTRVLGSYPVDTTTL